MNIHVDKLYSVLYTHEGQIHYCGPFVSDSEAMDYIRKHFGEMNREFDLDEQEFDLDEQYVYILTPDHRLMAVSLDDLNATPDAG